MSTTTRPPSTVQCDSYTGYPTYFRSNGGPPDIDHMYICDTNPYATGSIPFWEFSALERMGGDGHYAKGSVGGPGHIDINNAKIRYKLKWVPRQIYKNYQMIDDPEDVPVTDNVYVHLKGEWTAKSRDISAGKEHADVTLSLVGEGGGASASKAGVYTGDELIASTNVETTIKLDVNGRREIWLPWLQVSAHASLDGDRWDGPSNNSGGRSYPGSSDPRTWWRGGYEAQFGHFYADAKEYFVYISSDIEPSWKKFPGGLSALSDEYKLRNPDDGTVLNQADDNKARQVAGQKTPNDESDDIWKIQCLPSHPRKNMQVHSAAEWLDPKKKQPGDDSSLVGGPHSMGTKGWYGSVLNLAANTSSSFVDPHYKWTQAGGSFVNNLSSFSDEYNPGEDPAKEIARDTPVISIRSRLESYARSDFASAPNRGTLGMILGVQSDGSDLTGSSTFTVKVTDMDPGSPSTPFSDTYTVNWHLPAEWQSPKAGKVYWDSAEPTKPIENNSVGYQQNITAAWKWKTLSLGEVPNAEDYYDDANIEAWETINDVLGITDYADKSVDDGIEAIEDPRLKILVGVLKKAGKLYIEKLGDSTPETQTATISYSSVWQEQNNPSPRPNSEWVNSDGNEVPHPSIGDFGSLTAAERAALGKWYLKDPICNVERHPYLYRGDAYNVHGYDGYTYAGAVVGNTYFITGTFELRDEPSPSPDPTPDPH